MPIYDPFKGQSAGFDSPASNAFVIVPNDTADLATLPRGLLLGQGGDLAVTFQGGETVVLRNLSEGIVYPFRVRAIAATGTTATDIIGLY
ncbi:spike base protein, RCAP_Rcc01079 family [Roseivivax sp. CAU 1753]